jgi:hypothetical protein
MDYMLGINPHRLKAVLLGQSNPLMNVARLNRRRRLYRPKPGLRFSSVAVFEEVLLMLGRLKAFVGNHVLRRRRASRPAENFEGLRLLLAMIPTRQYF